MESHWGDLPGEPLLPPRSVYYGKSQSTFFAWLAALILGLLVLAFVAGLYLFSTQPSLAQMQVPKACIELAESLGRTIPPVLGRFKYERAKAELRNLDSADPSVKACREALAKLEARK